MNIICLIKGHKDTPEHKIGNGTVNRTYHKCVRCGKLEPKVLGSDWLADLFIQGRWK